MSNAIIKKLKLRDSMFATLAYDLVHDDNIRDPMTKEGNHPVHDDFKNKLQALAVHCIFILELVDVAKVKGDLENFKHPLLEKITVKSISLGENEGEGVSISFDRKLSTGKVAPMNTPYTKFYDETAQYKFNTDLELAVNDLLHEADEYLQGTKYGVVQLEMDFPEGSVEDQSSPL